MKNIIILLITILGFATFGHAVPTYYWIASGGTAANLAACDTANTTPPTPSAPSGAEELALYCSYDKANGSGVAAGDTVYYRAGTYNVSGTAIAPYNDGTAESRITFSSYTGETVNFVGQSSGSIAINIQDRNYIHITGLVGSGTSGYGMTFTSFGRNLNGNYSFADTPTNYCEIDHVEFGPYYGYPASAANCPSVEYRGSTLMRGSQYNWLHDNYWHDWQCFASDYDGPVCFELGIEETDTGDSYNVLENNVFAHCGHHVVGLQGSYNVFRNNVMHNENYYDISGTTYGYRNLYNNGYGNNLIEGNRIGPSGISYLSRSSVQRGGTSFYMNSGYNLIRYNAIFGALGMAMNYRRYSMDVSYNYAYNQTFYYTGYSDEDDINCYERFPINLDYDAGNIEYNVIKNTLFNQTWPQTSIAPNQSGCGTRPVTPVIYGTLTTMTIANNLESSSAGSDLFTDPDMTDAASTTLPDLTLKSSTAAIDAGGALTTIAVADTGSGTSLIVTDARYFQDGKFGQSITWPAWITTVVGDWIAVGTVSNTVQISSVNYSTNTITLANGIDRSDGDSVWLYKKSDGTRVLYGSAPDYGAHEYYAGEGSNTVTVSLTGTGCSLSITGEREVAAAGTLSVTATINNGWQLAWSGSCPQDSGTTTRVCTPDADDQTMVATCTQIQLFP